MACVRLVHAYKFRLNVKNRFIIFLKNLTIPRLFINFYRLQRSRILETRKVIQRGFKCHKFSPEILCFISNRPHYSLALFSSFIYTCSTSECHCLRECYRGQKLWSTDLAETWHRSCDKVFQEPLWLTSLR